MENTETFPHIALYFIMLIEMNPMVTVLSKC